MSMLKHFLFLFHLLHTKCSKGIGLEPPSIYFAVANKEWKFMKPFYYNNIIVLDIEFQIYNKDV